MDPKAALRIAPRGFIGALVPLMADPFAHAADAARGRSLPKCFAASAISLLQIRRDSFGAPSLAAIANNPATSSTSLEIII